MGKYAWALMGLGIILIGIALFLIYSSLNPTQEGVDYVNASAKEITIELPYPNATVAHTFSVSGTVLGEWFSTTTLPVVVLSPAGDMIGGGAAGTNPPGGDWQAEGIINYKGTVTVPDSFRGEATLVIKKDHRTGDPDDDAWVSIPIKVQ
jgi:hypothetical protein